MQKKDKRRNNKMLRSNISILKNYKELSCRMEYPWIKSKSKYRFLFVRLKKNNIYVHIYDKLNNPDK